MRVFGGAAGAVLAFIDGTAAAPVSLTAAPYGCGLLASWAGLVPARVHTLKLLVAPNGNGNLITISNATYVRRSGLTGDQD